MLVKPSPEEALAQLETWLIAPSHDYRVTLSWLAVLPPKDYELYLSYVAAYAEVTPEGLAKEVEHRRKILDPPQVHPPYSPQGAAPPPAYGNPAPYPSHGAPVPYQGFGPPPQQPYGPPPAYYPAPPPQPTYPLAPRCNFCSSPLRPRTKSQVSATGWALILLWIILTFTLNPAFLLLLPTGLFFRKRFEVCTTCRRRLT